MAPETAARRTNLKTAARRAIAHSDSRPLRLRHAAHRPASRLRQFCLHVADVFRLPRADRRVGQDRDHPRAGYVAPLSREHESGRVFQSGNETVDLEMSLFVSPGERTGPRDAAELDEALLTMERGPMSASEIAWMKRVGAAVRDASQGDVKRRGMDFLDRLCAT